MRDVIKYITEVLKSSICFVPRGIDEEKMMQAIGKADMILKNIPADWWLPKRWDKKKGYEDGGRICRNISMLPPGNTFMDFEDIEKYREVGNFKTLYEAAKDVQNNFINNSSLTPYVLKSGDPSKRHTILCSLGISSPNISVVVYYFKNKKLFFPLQACVDSNDQQDIKEKYRCYITPSGTQYPIQYNVKNERDYSNRRIFITDDLEIADLAQQKLEGDDSRCWFSWYGGKDAVSSIDWNMFRNSEEVYYLIVKQPGSYFHKACDTAYEVYKKLRRAGVKLNIIYALRGLAPIVINPKIFFKYTMEEHISQNFVRKGQRIQFDNFFINPQSVALVYGPCKAGTTSFVQERLQKNQSKAGILYIWGQETDVFSDETTLSFSQRTIPNKLCDVTSEIGQAYIESELMFYEHQNRKSANLLILDGLKSLDKLSKKLEAVDCMIDWLKKLTQRGCAVILVPPGRAWTEKSIKTIKKIPFDNIIRIEKENSYGAHEIVISQHFELIDGADKFMRPRVWECRHACEPLVWEHVFDKNIEDDAIKNELTKLAKRGEENKDIALRLGKSEELIKKLRRKYKLSKPQKNRPQKYVQEMNKHNRNVYKTINTFLKKCSHDVMDVLAPKFFDEIIIKFHFDKLSPEEIRKKIKGLYSLDFPLSFIVKEIENIDKAKSWLSRKLDVLYPFLFCNSIPIQCRDGSKNFDKTLYLVSAVTMSGQKELLGMWLTDADNEKFVLEMVKSLKERGMQHFLVAFLNESLMEASSIIKDLFGGGDIQKYLPDVISGTIASFDSKNRKSVNADILNMFTSSTSQETEKTLALLVEKWQNESSRINQLRDNFDILEPFFKYSPETRKFIYSCKANSFVGNALKRLSKNELSTEISVLKLLYQEVNASGKKAKPVRNWEKIMDDLKKHFKAILEEL